MDYVKEALEIDEIENKLFERSKAMNKRILDVVKIIENEYAFGIVYWSISLNTVSVQYSYNYSGNIEDELCSFPIEYLNKSNEELSMLAAIKRSKAEAKRKEIENKKLYEQYLALKKRFENDSQK